MLGLTRGHNKRVTTYFQYKRVKSGHNKPVIPYATNFVKKGLKKPYSHMSEMSSWPPQISYPSQKLLQQKMEYYVNYFSKCISSMVEKHKTYNDLTATNQLSLCGENNCISIIFVV